MLKDKYLNNYINENKPSVDMDIGKGIFESNQIALCPCFTVILETGWELRKTGIRYNLK